MLIRDVTSVHVLSFAFFVHVGILVFNSINDPAFVTPHGFSEMGTISIWPQNGRNQLNPDKYNMISFSFSIESELFLY